MDVTSLSCYVIHNLSSHVPDMYGVTHTTVWQSLWWCGCFFLLSTALDFTTDGRRLALAERRDCKDFISIFSCDGWSLIRVSGCVMVWMCD